MYQPTLPTKGSGYGVGVHGKCICVSIPYHELHLIEECDRLAHLECVTRSQFLRRCIRREADKVNEQMGKRYLIK